MSVRRAVLGLVGLLSLVACSDDGPGAGGGGGAGGAGGGGGDPSTGGGSGTSDLATLDGYLRGDFDNQEQVDGGFSKLVERHVCAIPGRDADPSVLWLYVEHVEVLGNGDRDAYFTRVNEIREVDGKPVSRAYKFVEGHPLYTDAFSLNGERDGCLDPDLLATIVDADLVYRDGCDVTFTRDGEVFLAATAEGTCSFPGGYIQTTATVFADGMDTTDLAVSGGQEVGEEFRFRRVAAP